MRCVRSVRGRFGLLVVLGLVSSACAGARPTLDDSGAARQVDPAAASAVDESPDEEPVANFEPLVLRLGVSGQWRGDPADAGPASLVVRALADLLHEGLTALASDGTVAPGLAERWFVTEDRLAWTFILPGDLVDGLGGVLTARDVKHSLESVAARGAADQAATALVAVSGWTAHMNGESGGIAGIIAVDERTLVVELDRPFELLLNVLASPSFGITGITESGQIRTTGAYRYGEDPSFLVAVDPRAGVGEVELVRSDSNGADLLEAGRVDWIVLAPGEGGDELPGDIVRQPLDIRVGIAVRVADEDHRRAILSAINPVAATQSIDTLNPLVNPRAAESLADLPPEIEIDVPPGRLASVGQALVAGFEDLGILVRVVESDAQEFAERVSSGRATIFPVVMAGGSAVGEAVLRISTNNGIDDVLGSESAARKELVESIGAEADVSRRQVLIAALEASLLEDGLLLPIGRFEVRIGLGPDMDGLRHRPDGTLDLSQLN